jgi:GNAT superfamily N-acetyltransferase
MNASVRMGPPKVTIVIRDGGAGDVAVVGALHALSRFKTYDFIDGYRPEPLQAAWRHRFEAEQATHRLLIASVAEAVVGFAYVGEGCLYAIHVHPEWLGKGAGAALMEAARKALRELGFDRAVLWVVEGNERACRFYERDGWTLSGQRRVSDMDGVVTAQLEYVRAL